MISGAKRRWPIVQFKEVVAHSAFGPRFSGDLYSEAGNVATLRTTDLSPTGEISYSSMPLAQIDENKFANHFLRIGDLVISRSGRIGTTAVFKGFELPVLPGAFLIRFRLCHDALPEFYRYFLNSPAGQALIQSVARGAAQQNINISNVELLNVPHPATREQETIAYILSAYDELIENNRRRIALLEEAARLLYREWFVHFRFPGHENERIVDGIPEGWEKRYLGNIVSTQYGYTTSASDDSVGPKFLRGTDINKRSFIDWASVPYCSEQGLNIDKYALEPDDILVIRMADPGKTAIVEKRVRAIFASYLVRLKILNPCDVPPLYMFMTLQDDRYQSFIGASSGGSTRKSASAKLLTDYHFLMPSKTLLQLFVEQILPMRKMITKLVDQSATAAEARDLLLPHLMKGEITV